MKANSIQPANFFKPVLPFPGHWNQGGSTRQPRADLRPLAFGSTVRQAAANDEASQKQELVCSVILVLCLLATFVLAFAQIALG